MFIPTALWYPSLAAVAAGTVAQFTSGLDLWRVALWALVWFGIVLVGQHRTTRRDEPPVVWSWFPFIGSALSFGSDTLSFIRSSRQAYGPAFTVIIGGQRMTFITDPLAYPKFLKMVKVLPFTPVADDVMVKVFGLSRKTMDLLSGELAKKIHDITIENMQGKHALASLTVSAATALESALSIEAVVGSAPKLLDGWARVPFYNTVALALFKATSTAIFGANFATKENFDAFMAFDKDFPLMVAGVPMSGGLKARNKLMAQFDGQDYEAGSSPYIQQRAKAFRQIEQEQGMSNVEHSGSQVALIWATVANTMPAAFWTLFYLVRDPIAAAAVTAELKRAANTKKERTTEIATTSTASAACFSFGPEELDGLAVLDSCITEALRLTSGSIVMREAVPSGTDGSADKAFVELELPSNKDPSSPSSVFLRRGDRVAIFPPLSHLDPTTFEDPGAFKHDRFLGPGGEALAKGIRVFGGGTSMCPGRHFARREVKSFVALAFARFEWRLTPPPLSTRSEENVGQEEREPTAVPVPASDQSRAGLGVYPPKQDLDVYVRART